MRLSRDLLPGLCGVVALTILLITHVPAEIYPSRPIQVIVPATPGGPADTAIRMIEPDLSAVLGTPLILVNRPGASGIVGMSGVAAAAPTGYTIGAGVNSIFTVVRISASTVPFTIDDFLIIGNYASDVSILAVRPDAPWRSFEEFIEHARSNPGKLSYASAEAGTVSSLSMQSITTAFKLDITAVPFAGGAQLTMAVIGGHVDAGVVPYSTGAQMLREGKLRPLLTTASTRLPSLPDTPTLSEKGLPAKGFISSRSIAGSSNSNDRLYIAMISSASGGIASCPTKKGQWMLKPVVQSAFRVVAFCSEPEQASLPALLWQRRP